MKTEDLIQRINELACKKKNQGLTSEESAEQKKLYNLYLDFVRKQVTATLDAAGINPRVHDCNCTCCQKHHHDSDRKPRNC